MIIIFTPLDRPQKSIASFFLLIFFSIITHISFAQNIEKMKKKTLRKHARQLIINNDSLLNVLNALRQNIDSLSDKEKMLAKEIILLKKSNDTLFTQLKRENTENKALLMDLNRLQIINNQLSYKQDSITNKYEELASKMYIYKQYLIDSMINESNLKNPNEQLVSNLLIYTEDTMRFISVSEGGLEDAYLVFSIESSGDIVDFGSGLNTFNYNGNYDIFNDKWSGSWASIKLKGYGKDINRTIHKNRKYRVLFSYKIEDESVRDPQATCTDEGYYILDIVELGKKFYREIDLEERR